MGPSSEDSDLEDEDNKEFDRQKTKHMLDGLAYTQYTHDCSNFHTLYDNERQERFTKIKKL